MHELQLVDWDSEVLSLSNPDLAYERFINIFNKTYQTNFPLTRISRRGLRDKKWITEGLKIASKHKNALYRKWLKSRNPIDNLNYKKYKNIFTKISREAEASYYKTTFDKISNNTKKVWDQINNICSFKSKQKSKSSLIAKLKIDNAEIVVPQEICNELNKYFCSVGSNLANKLPQSKLDYTRYMDPSLKESFFLQ